MEHGTNKQTQKDISCTQPIPFCEMSQWACKYCPSLQLLNHLIILVCLLFSFTNKISPNSNKRKNDLSANDDKLLMSQNSLIPIITY